MNMIELSMEQLEQKRQTCNETLKGLDKQCALVFKEYSDLGEIEFTDLDDELDRIDNNIRYMEAQIKKLAQTCQRNQEEKKMKLLSIQEFEGKREKLAGILATENVKLEETVKGNAQIQQKIKICREEHEKYQEQLYNIDTRGENLKKYGSEIVPQNILDLHKRKQELQTKSENLDERIQAEKKAMSKMVRREQIEELQEKIQESRSKEHEMKQLLKENEDLTATNEQLNEIKSEYEWNPNLQIKTLEQGLEEQQKKIDYIEKQITNLHKKNAQCLQKIEQYKKYIKIRKNNAAQTAAETPEKKDEKDKKVPKEKGLEQISRELQNQKKPAQQPKEEKPKKTFNGLGKEYKQMNVNLHSSNQLNRSQQVRGWIIMTLICFFGIYIGLRNKTT